MQSGILHDNRFYPDPPGECAFCMRVIPFKQRCVMFSNCCRRRCHFNCFAKSAWARDFPDTVPCPECLRQPTSTPCKIQDPGQTKNSQLLLWAFRDFQLKGIHQDAWIKSLGMSIYESSASLSDDDDMRLVLYATQNETGEHLPNNYADLASKGFRLEVLLSVFPALSAEWLRSLTVDITHLLDFAKCVQTLAARYGRATDIYRGVFYGLAPQIFAGQSIQRLAAFGVYAEDLLGMGLTPTQVYEMRMDPNVVLRLIHPGATH